MRSRIMVVALAAFIVPLGFAAAETSAIAYTGVWQADALTTHLTPSNGSAIPFTAAGAAQYAKNQTELKNGTLVDQADYACVPQGMPRSLTGAYPFQIISAGNMILFAHEQNRAYRIVHVASRHFDPVNWDPSYMGDGIARLEGDDLIIDSTNFNSEKIFLDNTGLPASDSLHLVEHLRLLNNGTELQDIVTIDDPGIFTKPWNVRLLFNRLVGGWIQVDWVCGEPHPLTKTAVATHPGSAATAAVPLTPAHAAFSGYYSDAGGWGQAGTGKGNTPTVQKGPPTDPVFKQLTPYASKWVADERAAMVAGKAVYDPNTACYPSTVPGDAFTGVYGWAIMVQPDLVAILNEENRTMRIAYFSKAHAVHVTPSWMGDSIARWDGNDLVIDTIGLNGKNTIPVGFLHIPISSKAHIVEHFHFLSDGQLSDTSTFDDPLIFKGIFVHHAVYRRGKPFQEFICQENDLEGGYPTSTGHPKASVIGGDRPQAKK